MHVVPPILFSIVGIVVARRWWCSELVASYSPEVLESQFEGIDSKMLVVAAVVGELPLLLELVCNSLAVVGSC